MKTTILYTCLFFTLITQRAFAQTYTVSGNVKSKADEAISNTSITLKNTSYAAICDINGNYQLKEVKPGNYTISASAVGFKTVTKAIDLTADLTVNFVLDTAANQLKIVSINDGKEKTFGITRLKSVEGTTLNAGKKSEVIVMSDVTANKAANTTRQLYAKVAGLNIWENDGAGIQLGVGGRGLNPNRVTNFNTRQNGYDISADALGYPESYYTPPAEMVDRIEILRGAASLQYGTQFGGLINFKLAEGPADKPFEITSRESAGSWSFFNTTNSIGGTVGKLQYYTFFQHKQGDGWRPNSDFNANTGYVGAKYKFNDKISLSVQYTYMGYLAHQAGGLTDAQFNQDPHQSNRARNWFNVNWNLGAAIFDYAISDNLKFNSRFFGLSAGRGAVGNLDYINRQDNGALSDQHRDLYVDKYNNYGNESRLLYTYKIGNNPQNLLLGMRYYHGHTNRQQGKGNTGSTGNSSDFDFTSESNETPYYSNYNFPENNLSILAENIFRITPKFSIIPGIRFEDINTYADGDYTSFNKDGAGNFILNQPVHEVKNRSRNFVIAGLGLSYLQSETLQFYANISQNYRAINFNDIHLTVASKRVNPGLEDETGYSADAGFRGNISSVFNYDVSVFYIHYDNRIGNIQLPDPVTFNIYQYRTNVSQSRNIGLESFAELELLHFLKPSSDTKISVFSNLTLINAKYVNSKEPAYQNRKVELAPDVIFKTGLSFKHQKFAASYQFSYTSDQFADATNAIQPTADALDGLVPAYSVMDLSASYKFSRIFTVEGSVNNLADARYFTRRAESYPGPGIIPADARSFFLTLQIKL